MPRTESHIPHDATVGAELNERAEVVLYHPNGKSVRVPGSDAAFWLEQGFRHELVDVQGAADELKSLFPAALDAVLAYVENVTADGTIDTADTAAKATAEYAMRRLETAWGQLAREIEARYPVAQGQAVKMAMPDGAPRDVDPSQVAHYETQGWTRL